MSQAFLESTATLNGSLVLNVVLVTDTEKPPHQFIFSASTSLNNIKTEIQNYLDSILTSDTVAKSLQPGAMDLTPTPDAPPSKEELARQEFAKDLGTLQRMQRAVSAGLMQIDDPALVDLAASLAARFVPEYLDLV